MPLDEAALLIAAYAEPGPRRRRRRHGQARRPGRVLPGLHPRRPRRRTSSGRAASGPNTDDYYDPRNSFLNDVLERRVGIPITLAVLALEVGRRIGVPLAGVGMPGHFLLRDKVDRDVFIDPFDGGRLLDADGCRRLFTGRGRARTPPGRTSYLEPVGNLSIISRILTNLRAIYEGRRDLVNLRWVMALRCGAARRRTPTTQPSSPGSWRPCN